MSTLAPVLILGGYGSVGTKIIRMLRQLHPRIPVAIAGRDLGRAQELADQIGNSAAITFDLERPDLGLAPDVAYSIVVTAVRDLSLRTMRFAQARGIPYVALSDGVFEIGPTVVQFAHKPQSSPILLLGHSMGAVPMMMALACAGEFNRVDTIEVGAMFDPADPLGPASTTDMERIGEIGPSPLVLNRGRWRWAEPKDVTRRFVSIDGSMHVGQAVGLVDVFGLARVGAHNVRVDFAEGKTASTLSGKSPSHEVIVEIVGDHAEFGQGRYRYELVDPEGYAFLSARGIAILIENLLGLSGQPAPQAGLYFPESIVSPHKFVHRLQELGVTITAGHVSQAAMGAK